MKAVAAAASGTTTAAAALRRSRSLSADPTVRNLLRTGSAPTNTTAAASASPVGGSAQRASISISAAAARPTVTGPRDGNNCERLTRCRSVSSATRVRPVPLPPRCRRGFGAHPRVQGTGARAVAAAAPVDDTRGVGAAAAAAAAFAIATAQREKETGKENGGVAGSRVWCHRAEGVPGEAFDVEEVLVANKIHDNAEFGSIENVSDAHSSGSDSSSSSGVASGRAYCDDRRNDDNNRRQQRAAVVANSPSPYHYHHHSRENSGDASRFIGLGLEHLDLPRPSGDFPTAVGVADTSSLPSSKELRITDCYRFEGGGQLVGRGHRSTVSSATHRRTGQVVAVKRISRAVSSRREVRSIK